MLTLALPGNLGLAGGRRPGRRPHLRLKHHARAPLGLRLRHRRIHQQLNRARCLLACRAGTTSRASALAAVACLCGRVLRNSAVRACPFSRAFNTSVPLFRMHFPRMHSIPGAGGSPESISIRCQSAFVVACIDQCACIDENCGKNHRRRVVAAGVVGRRRRPRQ